MEKRVLDSQYIIIGGGASGLCSAILLARKSKKVMILEQNSKVGKKLLATGNGRCNITNKDISNRHFHSENPKFVDDVLKGFGFKEVEKFFTSIGIELVELEDGKVYPMSLQASSVVSSLEYEALSLGVEILTDTKVTSIKKDKESFLITTDDRLFTSSNLIIATGSRAYKSLGGSDSGYEFAKIVNHPLIDRYPTLVQLKSYQNWTKECSGVKIKAEVELYSNGEFITKILDDVLFTDYGVSGLAILDISRYVSQRLKSFEFSTLKIDTLPNISKDKLSNMLLQHIKKDSKKPLWLYLNGFINHKLAKVIIKESKTKVKYESELNRKEVAKIVYAIKNLSLDIEESRGFDRAEVVAGGVDTSYINPHNLESKLIPKLHFLGEVLDVDGDRGGYNLHFAWVSAMRVAL